jgi:FixJ family two-component response regulator
MSIVWLVDDDPAILRALRRLLDAEGYASRAFSDAASFLAAHDAALPGCAVIDLGLPGLDGLALQDRLTAEGRACPVIFLTGQGSIPAAVRAMRSGAVDFLTKPVSAQDLLAAIRAALARDAETRARAAAGEEARRRVASLTPREREVLDLVVRGLLNKQIAAELGAAEKTIKVHRGRVMQKMGVRSVAELVTLCSQIEDNGDLDRAT